jgi:hypothetical protein
MPTSVLLNQRGGRRLPLQIPAAGNQPLELRSRDRQSGGDGANPACFLVEVPDELASGGLPGVALSVPGEDGDSWTEERHLV